jgi:hypothetical protein
VAIGGAGNVFNRIQQAAGLNKANSSSNSQAASEVSSKEISKAFLKDVRNKKEFQKKIRTTLSKLNPKLNEDEVEDILENLPYQEQPPFCASYSEEGVAEELGINAPLNEADLYAIFLLFYNNLYEKAKEIDKRKLSTPTPPCVARAFL